MNEQERAEEHLKTIRRLMERATIYRAISAPTALVGGLLSLIASGAYLEWFSNFPAEDSADIYNRFLWLWLLVLVLTAGANTIFIVAGAVKRNEPVFSASMKAALSALAPAFIAGAAFTLAWLEPGMAHKPISLSIAWVICYGLGLLATSHFAPRSLTLLGWAFLLSGIMEMLLLGSGSHFAFIWNASIATHAGTLFMAATFGLFHLIYAACAWPREDTAPEM